MPKRARGQESFDPYETKRQQRKRPNHRMKDFRFASSVRTIRIQGRDRARGLSIVPIVLTADHVTQLELRTV